ncbi:hypothetical protein PSENEW3n2_00001738 [Picochlorum sp. SENEW3]|nr:hypothetical protein M9434_001968 [Picochlorum sp. BPE23]WPT10566.1 hypothetical protein PSENEW3n2_00001738 [Picochlorum sp. SENEW3]WPT14508.1 hypothetical protein PSENEW3_00001738 [Picochlorum sp. SENEW3]|mmetsp:Transcript_5099/g.10090  ORF Transcript_5099/g.10090 Transcript_5099/m.10090 type:complete len:114 (-) Transcript_5099:1087-1428(-)|eukprot:jgi/Picre1/30909/NNA_006268.t1
MTEISQAEKPTIQLFNQSNVRHNLTLANNSRVFSALIGGIVAGIGGITGFAGFLLFVVFQIMNAGMLYAACQGSPATYFSSPTKTFFAGLTSQTELLTFILLWTLSNNLVYLF